VGRIWGLLACSALWVPGQAFGQPNAVYEIDSAKSDLHWLVYKAGTLERLGHNHVISVPEPKGTVTVDEANLGRSQFSITFPVATLVIDDPGLRSGLGEPFSSVPSESDVAGTRKNMLSERVLSGEQFPTISVHGIGPTAIGSGQQLAMTVEMLGRTMTFAVPTKVSVNAETVEAQGEFELTHTELGMKPFSVMLGALQVADKMTFVYHVYARRGAGD